MKSLKELLAEQEKEEDTPIFKQRLKGGKADNIDPSRVDQKELMKGIHVEFEHTNDVLTALEVSTDHLAEDPLYYSKLEKMENK